MLLLARYARSAAMNQLITSSFKETVFSAVHTVNRQMLFKQRIVCRRGAFIGERGGGGGGVNARGETLCNPTTHKIE